MEIVFDKDAAVSDKVKKEVEGFLKEVNTREHQTDSPIIIYQDGKSKSYYIKCSILAKIVCNLLDLNARLDPLSDASFRANRELLLKHHTYQRMRADAEDGREFNDIIVEYLKEYLPKTPLKVWGGQHRSKAIQEAFKAKDISRYHGFRIFFCLTKEQRTELALISNTNIAVSNDLFDRQLEETEVGTQLREWCTKVGLLNQGDDFPDQASRAERVSVKLARTFIVNYYRGKEKGNALKENDLDKNVYEPYLCESGAYLDSEYEGIIKQYGETIWSDSDLLKAGSTFAELHKRQRDAVVGKNKNIDNRKGFRNKALTASVLSGWSYVAGLLQNYPGRLANLYQIPEATKDCPDPLNAKGMSIFHHQQDPPTYRGLGTRSSLKDRQRMAQVFLAKSKSTNACLDKTLLNKAVSVVIGLKVMEKGYYQL